MIRRIKWFDRKFDFNFSSGIFPCIVERLRGTPARIEEIIHSIPEQLLKIKNGNSWSIQEHTGHLYDLELLHEGRIEDYINNEKILRPADLKNRKTFEADHNSKEINLLLELFRSERKKFVKKLEELDEEIINRVSIHPRLNQPMRLVDMAYFTAEHDDHHLASIVELSKFNMTNF